MKLQPVQIILLFILSIAFIFPYAGQFAYPALSKYSDLIISHYPNLIYIRHSLQTWGEIPLWSEMIQGGYPFAADPLSGLWYLPTWILFLLPLPFGFNLLILLHILCGAAGLYLLLRSLKYSNIAAVIGSMAFLLMPKIFAHYAAGHITLVFAVSWTPWLLWLEEKSHRDARGWMLKIAPGVVLGIIFLADVRWAVYSGLLYIAYSQFIHWSAWFTNPVRTLRLWRNIAELVIRLLGKYLIILLFMVMISAPLLFPLMEFTRLSTRNALAAEDRLALSITPGQLLGLFYPDLAGYAEWVFYPGALGIIALLFVLIDKSARRKNAFWLFALFGAILFALGPATPAASFLSQIPVINLLRVPARAMFIAGIAFCVFICTLVDNIGVGYEKRRPCLKLAVVGMIAFGDIMAGGVWALTKQLPIEFLWGAVMFSIIGGLLLLFLDQKISANLWFIGLIPLLVLDLGGVSSSQLKFHPSSKVLSEGQDLAQYLSAKTDLNSSAGLFRIYSPTYSIPQHAAARFNLQLADGIDPLQLEIYSAYMEKASGIPRTGYSVTIPSFSTGNPDIDNIDYVPDPELLGILNVRFIVSNFEIYQKQLILLNQFGNQRIYGNIQARPRAWIQKSEVIIDPTYAMVDRISESPNRISVEVDGPGMLVLSETFYPGWVVSIDGKTMSIQKVAGLLRGVPVESGHHLVEFIYRPILVYVGAILALFAWIFFGYTLFGKR